jgi:hypothetical protein
MDIPGYPRRIHPGEKHTPLSAFCVGRLRQQSSPGRDVSSAPRRTRGFIEIPDPTPNGIPYVPVEIAEEFLRGTPLVGLQSPAPKVQVALYNSLDCRVPANQGQGILFSVLVNIGGIVESFEDEYLATRNPQLLSIKFATFCDLARLGDPAFRSYLVTIAPGLPTQEGIQAVFNLATRIVGQLPQTLSLHEAFTVLGDGTIDDLIDYYAHPQDQGDSIDPPEEGIVLTDAEYSSQPAEEPNPGDPLSHNEEISEVPLRSDEVSDSADSLEEAIVILEAENSSPNDVRLETIVIENIPGFPFLPAAENDNE